MSEPKEIARSADEIVPGVWRWAVHDDRIDYESDAHAVVEGGRAVLIDPIRLDEASFRRLGTVEAICLTAACHQRSAWHYRNKLGVRVYAPQGSREMDEAPDVRYQAGDRLPGGLEAIPAPGPEKAHFAFRWPRESGVVFCPDLLMHGDPEELSFIPAEYHEDPDATRESVRRLLDLRFSVLCFAHGAPIVGDPQAALREVLQKDAEQRRALSR